MSYSEEKKLLREVHACILFGNNKRLRKSKTLSEEHFIHLRIVICRQKLEFPSLEIFQEKSKILKPFFHKSKSFS